MTAPRKVLGWWFCAPDADGKIRLPHGDGREVVAGKTLSVKGRVKACESGLHASVRAIDALQYAPGATVCRVEVWGSLDESDPDKVAGSHRRVLWMADATKTLRLFGCDCAEEALVAERNAGREPDPRSWASVEVARRFIASRATSKELNAAESAAWSAATSAARSAATSAARSAAESAATSAARSAAESAQNDTLERALLALPQSGEGER